MIAYQAMQSPDLLKIGVCIVYDLGVVLPLVFLALRGNTNVQPEEA
jgi:hypothetical protein